jgi:hypothetical protein
VHSETQSIAWYIPLLAVALRARLLIRNECGRRTMGRFLAGRFVQGLRREALVLLMRFLAQNRVTANVSAPPRSIAISEVPMPEKN